MNILVWQSLAYYGVSMGTGVKLKSLCKNPALRVLVTYAWFFIGVALIAMFVLLVLHIDLPTARRAFGEQRYLAVYIELISAGLMPILISLACGDDPALYGLQKKGFVTSLLLSAALTALWCILLYAFTGSLVDVAGPDVTLAFPWNLFYAALGIFTYGPLEVFFVMWLITNTDKAFKADGGLISPGLALTVILFGALHLITTQSLTTTVSVGLLFFFLGAIHKLTKNSIGPMVAWTILNGQAWYYAMMLKPL